MKRTLLLALLSLAATLLFTAAALAQEESGTEQYSESDYCEKRIGTKDAPFASPSFKGEWEYDAINDCLAARQQEEAADPASCSEILENAYRFSVDRVEACEEQGGAGPDTSTSEGPSPLPPCPQVVEEGPGVHGAADYQYCLGEVEKGQVPETVPDVPCTEVISPEGIALYGEERRQECEDQLEGEARSSDPCSGSLFFAEFAGTPTEDLRGAGGYFADPALVDPDENGVVCDSTEPADRGQYAGPPVEDPEEISCAELVGDPDSPNGIRPPYEAAPNEELAQECLARLEAELALAVGPNPPAGGLCDQPVFAELFAGGPAEKLAYLSQTFRIDLEPALVDPDGNGIACDSTEPAAPVQPQPEETVPEERAQAPDPCAELSFAKRYAGRPVAEAPNPEDRAVDPDGTGVVCGHVLAEHGHVPFGGEPETGRVLPLTGGPVVAPLVGLLLGFGVIGAALRSVARGA